MPALRLRAPMLALIAIFLIHPGAAHADSAAERIIDRVFTELERAIIDEYYRDRGRPSRRGLPPGLAKRERLPPGLQMQLARGGSLPPGLEKRALPRDLAAKLPKRPQGHQRVVVGSDVILIEAATGVILDVLRGVLTRS